MLTAAAPGRGPPPASSPQDGDAACHIGGGFLAALASGPPQPQRAGPVGGAPRRAKTSQLIAAGVDRLYAINAGALTGGDEGDQGTNGLLRSTLSIEPTMRSNA